MPKLTLPSLSEKKRESLKRFGLKIIESLSVEEFEQVVTDYLNLHNVLHLSTCRNNQPRSTTVEYFNNGLTVYILSEGGGKIINIKANPEVSYTISDPYHPAEDFFGAAGLQVWGNASVFQKNDDPQRFDDIIQHARYGDDDLVRQGIGPLASTTNFNVITIKPETIRYLNYRGGFRKAKWER